MMALIRNTKHINFERLTSIWCYLSKYWADLHYFPSFFIKLCFTTPKYQQNNTNIQLAWRYNSHEITSEGHNISVVKGLLHPTLLVFFYPQLVVLASLLLLIPHYSTYSTLFLTLRGILSLICSLLAHIYTYLPVIHLISQIRGRCSWKILWLLGGLHPYHGPLIHASPSKHGHFCVDFTHSIVL